MNLMPWRNADADTKHDVIVMLVIHGLLVALNLWLIVFAVNRPDMMIDGELYQAHTRLVLGISNTVRNYFFFPIIPCLPLVMWVDAWICIKLRLFHGRSYTAAWNVLVVIAHLSFTCFVIWGMRLQTESLAQILRAISK